MTEIFIENKAIDISTELENLLTFSVDDVRDFAARNTAFSKTIVIPGTANNNRLFGSIFDVRISNPYTVNQDNVGTNFNPAVEADCIILQDHLQIFKGTLRMLEIIIDGGMVEYEVSCVGELGGLVSALGNKRLEDLDFSVYDHVYNLTNVTGSWGNNASGFFYPLIDYAGTSSNKVDWDIRALRPAFFVREYLDKIFSAAGYTYTAPLFDTVRFKNLIIPNNQQLLSNRSALQFFGDADLVHYSVPAVMEWTISTFGSFYIAGGDFMRYTLNGSTTVSGNLHITLDGSYSPSGLESLYIDVMKNGSLFYRYNVGNVYTFYIDFTTAISFSPADYFEVIIRDSIGSVTLSADIIGGTIEIISDNATMQEINVGDSITAGDMIPRGIYQKDFLASVVKLFNLYITEGAGKSKHLNVGPYVDFYDLNVSGIRDWNYKVDRSRPMRIKPMSELNARYYNFRFKQDSDYYNEKYQKEYSNGYGDYVFDSDYDFSNEKTDMEIIFSASPLVGYAGKDKLVVPMYKLENSTEKETATNIRILQKKLITGVTTWAIKDAASTIWTGTEYPYAGNYDDPDAPANDIHFGVPAVLYFTLASGAINVTQFNVYWSPYMAEITDKDSRLLMCYVKLSAGDINQLDFSKLIYIDGCYWRLSKIEDWNANYPDVCKAEFLKVINTVY